MSETSLRVVAHKAVESTRVLDTARDKGRTHLDEPAQDLTFDDLIDIVNPLQHLPVVGMLYRAITGDEIKPAMRILGDIGYGGPMGFVFSCLQVLFEEVSGDDIAGHGLAMLTGDAAKARTGTAANPAVQLASNDPDMPLSDTARVDATAAYAAFPSVRGTSR
ncbi:MAG: hypothetical protein AB7S71_07060 [Dongiaceae bacterium]